MLLRPTIRCAPKSPDHVHVPVKATRSIGDNDGNHGESDLEPVSSDMGTGLHPGGLNRECDTQISGNSSCTTIWILCHHIQNHLFECWCPASARSTPIQWRCWYDVASLPHPLVQPVKYITVWMAACWMPFCISPGCSVGPVTTRTKDQIHIAVFVQSVVHFTCPFLLTSYCDGTTAQYNSKATTVHWVLITLDRGITGSYLRISCAVRHVLWTLVLPQRDQYACPIWRLCKNSF
jgi:hypothetical protein